MLFGARAFSHLPYFSYFITLIIVYENPFHEQPLDNLTFLVTGGAGFIGSNIVE